MLIVGLTGSIAVGKSTTAAMFRARGVPVHDADAAVHRLYSGEAVAAVAAAFAGVVRNGTVDRARLAESVAGDPRALARLEEIVHPLVRRCEEAFVAAAAAKGHRIAVLDIPLLLETGGAARVHAVLVVTAAAEVQRARALARPAMSEGKLEALLRRQMPDGEKRRRAHFLVDTTRGLVAAERQVDAVMRALAGAA